MIVTSKLTTREPNWSRPLNQFDEDIFSRNASTFSTILILFFFMVRT